jgi:hypothetical protein
LFLIIILFVGLIGCSSKESVFDIAEDDLLVEHWSQIDDERKFTVVRNAMDEGKIYMYPEGYKEYIEYHIKIMDITFQNQEYQSIKLKKAIIKILNNT